MKKLLTAVLLFIVTISTAQSLHFGIKGGANFSNINGDVGAFDFSTRTSYHIGGLVEIGIGNIIAFQPEIIYSVQGAKVEDHPTIDNIDLKYVNVPLMLKLYIVGGIVSLEAGPQFGFLTDHNLDDTMETEDFDFSVAGGLGVDLNKTFFIQARYIAGMNEFSKDADVKNSTIQLSFGIKF